MPRRLTRLIVAPVAVLLAGVLVLSGAPSAQADGSPARSLATASTVSVAECGGVKDTRTGTAKKVPFTVCSIPVISKKHRVSASYKPALVTVKVARSGLSSVRLQSKAATALKRLVAAAKKKGYTLVVRSAYRSWSQQKAAYARDKVLTAPPGASEHQSGLAVDLAARSRGSLIRGFSFGTSAAGVWTRKHAATYGFIVRYPNHRQNITGIPYEPWHLRYVGTDAAKGVVGTPTKTLERYLRVS